MPTSPLDEMKHYIGFDERDADALRSLHAVVEPAFAVVVDRFYEAILAHRGARAVLTYDYRGIGASARASRSTRHG